MKTLGKIMGMEGTKSGRNFILKVNCGGFKCHISKEHYGAYENVVLYNKLWQFLITVIL